MSRIVLLIMTVDRSFSAAKEIITHSGSDGTFLLGSGDVTMTVGTNDTIHTGKAMMLSISQEQAAA